MSEFTYQTIFDNSPIGIEIFDKKGSLLNINTSCMDILGLEDAEELKKYRLFEDQNLTQEMIESLQAGESVRFKVDPHFDNTNTVVFFTTTRAEITTLDVLITPLRQDGDIDGYMTHIQDVSGSASAEIKAREKEEQLRGTFACIQDGIVTVGTDRYIVDSNPGFNELFGYSPDEIAGLDMKLLYAKEEKYMELGQKLKAHTGDKPLVEVIDCIKKDGTVFTAEVTVFFMRDSDDNVTSHIGLVRDITERINAENDLRESQKSFRNLFESNPLPTFIWHHKEGQFILDNINKAANDLVEGKGAQFLGLSATRIYPDRPDIQKHILDCFTDKRNIVFFTEYLSRATGMTRQIVFTFVYVSDEVIMMHADDITKRKKAENVLKQKNLQLQAFWDLSRLEGIKLREVSDYVLKAIVEMTGSPYGFYGYMKEDESEMYIHAWSGEAMKNCGVVNQTKKFIIEECGVWAEAVRERRPLIINDYSLPHQGKQGLPTGHVAIEKLLVVPFFQGGKIKSVTAVANRPVDYDQEDIQQIEAFLGGIQNIIDRRLAEEEKETIEEQLMQAQKMEAVGRLAGGVAHDFNNMLSIVIGNADMVLDDIKQGHPFYDDLVEIRQAGERSADLTRQLLAFARKQTVAPKIIDVNKTLDSMLQMLERLIGEDIDMTWIPDKNVWPVRIDPGQIDQILANLCVNARDSIKGVGEVTIETGNTVFDEEYCKDHPGFAPGEYAMLAVSDSGSGMDSETQSRLFEPFFTTKDLGQGTGLGLATVYGVVKQNKGFINVYSELDHGTTIKVYLPRHNTKTTRPSEDSQEMQDKLSQRGHETILLVEDEKSILKMATRILERQGYRVVMAATPGEAIHLAEEHLGDIHLLMTDVVMPEMNGRDLAKKILSLYPNLKCLFMSGYTANVIAHHGVLDEGVNFVEKPFSKNELTVKVREVLEQN